MERTAKLIFEGKEFEFPIEVGTENEKAINIEKLRALTGLITLDSGYKNTGSCKSAITFLDGERGILRYRGYNIEDLAANDIEAISFIYNIPLWLINLWISEFGRDKTEDLCAWFNEQPKLTARINTILIDIPQCLTLLNEQGWDVTQDTNYDDIIYINSHRGSLEKSEAVINGYITFMDKASMLVARLVNPQPGECILDCCAAPGGKSMYMATLMNNVGSLMSCDIHEHKIELMNLNAERLGASIVHTKVQDATKLPNSWNSYFDRVLVDAPCSGLGILQKKLDMRWRKQESILSELPSLQLAILERAAMTVKENGYLIYSTCTLNYKENEGVVESFLQKHKEFSIIPVADDFPLKSNSGMITTYPPIDDMDGFFMVKMQRIS